MCGITGIVTPPGERPARALLERMTEALAHRGPDAAGVRIAGNVGLGHRRLSIIDLRPEADQPMVSIDDELSVVFNGEIYNFHQLTRELEDRGRRFRTRCDTEVLLHGWREWGVGMVERLRGMYALALHDAAAGRLLLARDRVGKKPLYWAPAGGGLVFGSEIKALLAHPGVARELDPASAGDFMLFGHTVGERSLWSAVRKLLPGHTLLLDTAAPGRVPAAERYWAFEPAPEAGLDDERWLDELDRALAEAVRLRMIADVPLGAFLSGGIDSSLVVAHMARQAPGRVATFCIGFREPGFDESGHAAAVAAHLGTDHHLEWVTPDALEVLPELVEAYDEPFADASAIPTWYVSRMTRRHVTVALSGDGGDELFGGYERYAETAALARLGRLAGGPGRRAAAALGGRLAADSFAGRALDRLARPGIAAYRHALGDAPVFRRLLTPEVTAALGPPGEHGPTAGDPGERLPLVERMRALDMAGWLPDDILVKVDRASMQHALEVRCPLLDQEVIALAARMPVARQLGLRRRKLLLRRLAARHLPAALLERPKQGFAVPLARWLRGPLAPRIRRVVADAASPTWRFFDRAEAGRRLQGHLAGDVDAAKPLWRLLVFHAWAERYLASAAAPPVGPRRTRRESETAGPPESGSRAASAQPVAAAAVGEPT